MGTAVRRTLRTLPGLIAVGTLPLAVVVGYTVGFGAALFVTLAFWIGVLPLSAIFAREVFYPPVSATNDRSRSRDTRTTDPPTSSRRRRSEMGTRSSDVERTESKHVTQLDPARGEPLDILRSRYARGDIGEDEFERTLHLLLETEDGIPEGYRREDQRE